MSHWEIKVLMYLQQNQISLIVPNFMPLSVGGIFFEQIPSKFLIWARFTLKYVCTESCKINGKKLEKNIFEEMRNFIWREGIKDFYYLHIELEMTSFDEILLKIKHFDKWTEPPDRIGIVWRRLFSHDFCLNNLLPLSILKC